MVGDTTEANTVTNIENIICSYISEKSHTQANPQFAWQITNFNETSLIYTQRKKIRQKVDWIPVGLPLKLGGGGNA